MPQPIRRVSAVRLSEWFDASRTIQLARRAPEGDRQGTADTNVVTLELRAPFHTLPSSRCFPWYQSTTRRLVMPCVYVSDTGCPSGVARRVYASCIVRTFVSYRDRICLWGSAPPLKCARKRYGDTSVLRASAFRSYDKAPIFAVLGYFKDHTNQIHRSNRVEGPWFRYPSAPVVALVVSRFSIVPALLPKQGIKAGRKDPFITQASTRHGGVASLCRRFLCVVVPIPLHPACRVGCPSCGALPVPRWTNGS